MTPCLPRLALWLFFMMGFWFAGSRTGEAAPDGTVAPVSADAPVKVPANTTATSTNQAADLPQLKQAILAGARSEAERHTRYHEEYHVLAYPGGDVPAGEGVCTDLVIRAFRHAGVDLQKELHEDRVAHAEAYPTGIWDNKRADRNIDHRRCQNLAVWFRRHAQALTTATDAAHRVEWQPGDVVFFVQPGATHPWHVAVVSDRKDVDGMPLIAENYPPFATEARRLDTWAPIHSHFRYDGCELRPAKVARDEQPTAAPASQRKPAKGRTRKAGGK